MVERSLAAAEVDVREWEQAEGGSTRLGRLRQRSWGGWLEKTHANGRGSLGSVSACRRHPRPPAPHALLFEHLLGPMP